MFMYRASFLMALASLLMVNTVTPGLALAQDAAGGGAIVNGRSTASPVSAGAVLFIGPRNDVQELSCSGVMIGAMHMLTAAHCFCKTTDTGDACQAQEVPGIDVAEYRVFLQHAGIFHVRSIHIAPSWKRDRRADLAVLRLSAPVTTQRPAKIIWDRPLEGQPLIPVGFGNTGDGEQDFGLKRKGGAIATECPDGILNGANFCWEFEEPVGPRGTDSNTCELDDGGPTYGYMGDAITVAGIHYDQQPGCAADSLAIDTNIPKNRPWLRALVGDDLGSTFWAGKGPFIDDNGVDGQGGPGGDFIYTETVEGMLGKNEDEALFSFQVPDRGRTLIFTVNGNTENGGDYDFFVSRGQPPTRRESDCSATGAGQFGVCTFQKPEAGTWWALVKHVGQEKARGKSRFQITAIEIREPLETGEVPSFPEMLRFEYRTKDETLARLFWSDTSDNETGFELERKVEGQEEFESYAFTRRNDNDFTDGVDPELEYTYRVRAFNASGFSLYSNECIVGHERPNRPTRLRAKRQRPRKIKLTWNDKSDDDVGFQLQRRDFGSGDDFSTIAEIDRNDNVYVDNSVRPGRIYEYRVRAIGRLDKCIPNSLWSRPKAFETPERR
jgi:hypothetical protein